MRKLFIYPLNQGDKGSPNPYVRNIANSISNQIIIVNAETKHRGVLNLFLFLFKADSFLLNWVETLPNRKFGAVQSQLFLIFLMLAKRLGKRIVWVLHNKGSHHGGNINWTEKMFKSLMHYSDYIITHSNEGLDFVKNRYPEAVHKVNVHFHPIGESFSSRNEIKKFDLLIWGSIFPYKGIDTFLDYLNKSNTHNLKILIIGKCFSDEYRETLIHKFTDSVVFKEELVGLEEIAKYAAYSKFVLFTYKSETILSSGVLMDSLRMNCRILGPNFGAFRDLAFLGIVRVYDDFQTIKEECENYDPIGSAEYQRLEDFRNQHTWAKFGEKLIQYI